MPEYKMNVLPISVVFGANAAGKSNLVTAIEFARNQITSFDFNQRPDQFRLDTLCSKKDSSFDFLFTINDVLYHYVFSLKNDGTVSYELLERAHGKKLKPLFERTADGKIDFGNCIPETAQIVIKSVMPQKFVLSHVATLNNDSLEELKRIYSWFRFNLVILTPASRLLRFTQRFMPTGKLSDVLHKLDTSVTKIDFEPISHREVANIFSANELDQVSRELGKDVKNLLITGPNDDFYKFELQKDVLTCSKMVSYHKGCNGKLVPFKISENSDGTRRCLHLFPAFNALVTPASDCCYIIDELDRSLHTNLVKQLLASFLDTRNQDTRSQLLLTCHDIQQMDQNVLRRDEIWIAERDENTQSTNLASLNEFRLGDKKIRKDRSTLPQLYTDGYLGGVPRIDSYANLFSYANGEKNG
ncbi:MAG: ATP-binding protein [Fibrobacteraceae bacterium]|nr:ATP-binding protein [Fibrobacteraceae bacterium]